MARSATDSGSSYQERRPDQLLRYGLVQGDERVIVEGRVDVTIYRPLARLGYRDYAQVRETFAMMRPDGE